MADLIKQFGVDWKLLIANAVNFFILLFVLKKFAYGPILEMLRKRREDIERGVRFTNEAETKLERADAVSAEIVRESERKAMDVVSQAEADARARKEEIVQETAKKVELVIADGKRTIAEEKAKMGDEIYNQAEFLVQLGIAKVLGRMKPEERDDALIKEAIKELKARKNI